MRRDRQAGFTLIEVLLTLLLMAGIMVTITQILTAARHSRDVIQNIQNRRLAGPAILDQLERDMRSVFTFNRDPKLHLRVTDRVLRGMDADSIDFVTTRDSLMPFRERENDDFTRSDVNEAGYCLRPNARLDDFLEIFRREDFGVDADPFVGGRYAFLYDRVKGFDVQVYAEDGPEAEPLDAWGLDDDENFGLPARIEVELVIELKPRLTREQLVTDRRTETYRRVIRFPQALLVAQEIRPVAAIPQLLPPSETGSGLPGAPGSTGTITTGDGSGLSSPDGGDTPNPFGDLGGSSGGPNPFGGGG